MQQRARREVGEGGRMSLGFRRRGLVIFFAVLLSAVGAVLAQNPNVPEPPTRLTIIGADCTSLPAPDPVDPDPLPGESPPGRYETTTVNGFTDDYIYDQLETAKVGIRREWGATIIFFGTTGSGAPGMNSTNTIDANDTGREVQVAFYDLDRRLQNCAWDATCVTSTSDCPESITYLGWNPVQGGNRCNIGSGVEGVVFDAGVLAATTIPLQWNPNWDFQDCNSGGCSDPSLRARRSDVRVVQSLKFIRPNVVQLDYIVTNLSDLDHRSIHQEMPTVYTANGAGGPDLWKMFNSQGNQISIDIPANDGFFYRNFESPGGWATMQNDSLDYGVGLYTENRITSIQAWQNRSIPFNNFRPVFIFGVEPFGTIRARSYLILGGFDTVAAEAQWLDLNLPPFGDLDAPAADAELSGNVAISGWALDNKGVAAVELVVDGSTTIPLTYGGSRPDVCRGWPGYPDCDNVAFSGTLDTTTLTPCQHLLEIRAVDSDGNQRIIARRHVNVSG